MSRPRSESRRDGALPDPDAHDALHPEIAAEIGRHLQAIYRAVLEEPVPDRFRKLLTDLKQREGKQRG